MILEYWINGLISGPATHATYMIGNTHLGLGKGRSRNRRSRGDRPSAKPWAASGETVRMGEVAEQIQSRRERNGTRGQGRARCLPHRRDDVAARRSAQAQNILRFPGNRICRAVHMLDEAAKLSDVIEAGFSIVRGMRDGSIAGGEIARRPGREPPPSACAIRTWARFPTSRSAARMSCRSAPRCVCRRASLRRFIRSFAPSTTRWRRTAVAYRTAHERRLDRQRLWIRASPTCGRIHPKP